jgi:hypothetical protein
VFDTRTDSCELIDVPDSSPRAFRDGRNRVYLVSTHYVARAMVGDSLDTVRRDCRVLYRSPEDPDPSHFDSRNWLMSFFSIDGTRIAALVHSEYEAWTVPGMCATPKANWPIRANFWWNTVTFALSEDGGNTFATPKPPGNLVASLPYSYAKGNQAGAYGYAEPTNILHVGDAYFAMLNDWPFRAQRYGACLIRTTDILVPSSWRAWDGKAFTIRFVDPYREHAAPEKHVCTPVGVGAPYDVQSLVIHQPSGTFLATQFSPDRRFGPPGLYLSASSDLIHWSRPNLMATTADLLAGEPPGDWSYNYFTLLDPTSRDRNFATVSDTPYIYFVRFDKAHPPYARVLFRRRLALRFGSHSAANR